MGSVSAAETRPANCRLVFLISSCSRCARNRRNQFIGHDDRREARTVEITMDNSLPGYSL
jgi:hypothetical protein